MTTQQIRDKFITFFQKRDHVLLPPSSLIPNNDSSVLFTTAGMQQFKDWFIHSANAKNKRVVTIQPSLRTSDIEQVGDATHLTYFEMLGHFSFGDYFKKEAIGWAWEFLTNQLDVASQRITATYFGGENNLSADAESLEILKKILPTDRIEARGKTDNFWGPTGNEGPCGPNVEFYVDGIEIWNSVFNEYYFKIGDYSKLKTRGVDMGGGLERIAQVVGGLESVFETDELAKIMAKIPPGDLRSRRIIADHVRAIEGLVKDGVTPSNKVHGAVLRRLIRRTAAHTQLISSDGNMLSKLVNKASARVIQQEIEKFSKTLKQARGIYSQILEKTRIAKHREISAHDGFLLQESYGLTLELTRELARKNGFSIDETGFEKLSREHQQKSRAGIDKKFKGGLVEITPETTKLHTTHHLLLAALRKTLGIHVVQRGSNITSERLRIDVSHDKPLTSQEILRVEKLVNDWISQDLLVVCEDMTLEQALKKGALGEFGSIYPTRVTVYSIIGRDKKLVSIEICGGPHVRRTSEIAGKFKVVKQESSGAGSRRIKCALI